MSTRPLYWSVRRELWESRSLTLAPLAAAGLVLLANVLGSFRLPARVRAVAALDPALQGAALARPYVMAAAFIVSIGIIVAAYYCLDALHGERRDRSILFWKSLPVSDRTTVLAKAALPLVVMPLYLFVIVIATHLILFAGASALLLMGGNGVATLWTRLPLLEMLPVQLYSLFAHALWHAPLYAWLLLVSCWARRTPFLWATLPLLAAGVLEKMAFGTSLIGHLLRNRVMGAAAVAFAVPFDGKGTTVPVVHLSQLAPGRFLLSPGLWLGLVAAAGFLALAVRLRRYREPL